MIVSYHDHFLDHSAFYTILGFITVSKIPVIWIIKIVTFYMNPKFAEVTLNSFVFDINILCTNPAGKFWMIDVTHGLASVNYTMIV